MTASPGNVVRPLRVPEPGPSLRRVFIRDLVLACSIGVYDFEHEAPQRVRINIDLAVHESGAQLNDDIGNVVCYEQITKGIRAIVADGHTKLVETLAERIAAMCLQDTRVNSARVRVEKLDVFADAASVGIEIERVNPTA